MPKKNRKKNKKKKPEAQMESPAKPVVEQKAVAPPKYVPGFGIVKSKGYHTADHTRHRGAQLCGPGGVVLTSIRKLSECTWRECNKTETLEERFNFCKLCKTKYCSKECQYKDHYEGEHKERCAEYQKEQAEELARYKDCPVCGPRCLDADFMMCKNCFFKP